MPPRITHNLNNPTETMQMNFVPERMGQISLMGTVLMRAVTGDVPREFRYDNPLLSLGKAELGFNTEGGLEGCLSPCQVTVPTSHFLIP